MARRRDRLRMVIGQQALRHRHRQKRDPGLLDEGANVGVRLRVSSALAENDQRAFGSRQYVERARDRVGRRDLAGCCVDDAHQRVGADLGVNCSAQNRARQIEINAARASRDSRADRAGEANANVLRPLDPVGGFGERLGRVHLVELFVFALLQIDGGPIARPADLDHRKAIGRCIGESDHPVQKAGRRDGQTDAGLPCQIAGDRRCVAGGGLMAEADITDP
jgi:hypothetical protein